VVEAMLDKAVIGRVHYDNRRIQLGRTSNTTGKEFRPEQIADTFWHEVVHTILKDMGEHRLNSNEAFVTKFANRLTEAIQHAKFE
jgi:hypothetical protein